jgi:hypothetical protein
MEKKELELKISHFESMLIAWQEALEELRRQNIAGGLVINGPVRKHKEVVQAMRDLSARNQTAEEVFNGRIEKLQDELKLLRLELIEIEKSKKEESLKFENERRLSILKKPLQTPKYFNFDRLQLQKLLNESNPNRNKGFSRREIGLILKSKNDFREGGFPQSIRVLRVVFALGLDLNDIRDRYVKFERIDKSSQLPFFDSEVRLFARDLQELLCTEIGNKNPKYSLENLKKVNFDNTTFHTFVMEHRQNGVVSALDKFSTLFEVEDNIKQHIPNFSFVDSGVIKYNPPNNLGL